jgi:hypothetical protein
VCKRRVFDTREKEREREKMGRRRRRRGNGELVMQKRDESIAYNKSITMYCGMSKFMGHLRGFK